MIGETLPTAHDQEPEQIATDAADQMIAALHDVPGEHREEVVEAISDILVPEGLLLLDAGKAAESDERRGRTSGLTRQQLLARMALDRVLPRTRRMPPSRRNGSAKPRLI